MRLLNTIMLLLCLPLFLVVSVYITLYGAARVLFLGDTVKWESPVSWKTIKR